jgi:FkbM family methyltransferase
MAGGWRQLQLKSHMLTFDEELPQSSICAQSYLAIREQQITALRNMRIARQFHESMLAQNGGAWPDFEGLVRDIYVSILKKGDVALDVGVNRGDHFLQMAVAVGSGGLVVGVEAAPAMVELTRSFLVGGGVGQLCNTILHNVAVGEKDGTAQFNYVKTQPGLSSLADREVARQYDVEVFECQITTIDKLLIDVARRVNFAKFDIEGAEYHAFKGSTRLFQRDRPPIVFEFDSSAPEYFGDRTEDLLGFFTAADYAIQDFFGFRYKTVQDFNDSMVWNYFAAPSDEIEGFNVKDLVAASLNNLGVGFPEL